MKAPTGYTKLPPGVKTGFYVKGSRIPLGIEPVTECAMGPYETYEAAEDCVFDVVLRSSPSVMYVLHIEKHYMPDLVSRKGGDSNDPTR